MLLRMIGLMIVFVAVLTVFHMDYKDEKKLEHHQCDMIEQGAWPESVAPWCRDIPNANGHNDRKVLTF